MWQPVDHIKVFADCKKIKKKYWCRNTSLSEKIKLGLLKNPLACRHANDAPGVGSRT